jgi:hypothetical protein
MAANPTVCWTPAQSTAPYSILDGAGSPYTNGIIPITAPTTFTLVAGNACSDASVQPFTMQIAPDVSTGEITVITASGPSVSFRANYVSVGKSSPINMTLLHTDQNGHKTTYVIDSGRPIIRNDPRRPFNPVYVIVGILVLAAALIYLLSR